MWHLFTWPNLVCPFADPMLDWLSWYVIVSDDQAGKPESFPSFTVMSISGAHHRQFRPGWTFADSASAKQPNFLLNSLPASTRLTSDATRDVQESELCPFGVIGFHKVFAQQLFAPLVTLQRTQRNRSSWCTLRRCCRGAPGTGHLCSPTSQGPQMEMGDSYLQPLETCRPRQSVFACENAARRALAS